MQFLRSIYLLNRAVSPVAYVQHHMDASVSEPTPFRSDHLHGDPNLSIVGTHAFAADARPIHRQCMTRPSQRFLHNLLPGSG
ncbi:MAG: hypothetical protein ACJAVR_002105 [Paracoccaceae bacterium]|jgi:hypothetical protein